MKKKRAEINPDTAWIWTKLSSLKWWDVWEERLTYVGLHRVVLTRLGETQRMKVEVFNLDHDEADQLVQAFGGSVRSQASWREEAFVPPPRPLRIRNQLVINADPGAMDALRRKYPLRKILLIPASAAFGTGDHPTTEMCLRAMADFFLERTAPPERVLDLGTGSGVLALGAAALRAGHVEGLDNDPIALGVARQNARANDLRRVRFREADVTRWKPGEPYDLIMANLFSELLVACAPRLAKALHPDGLLLVSGLMRKQEPECRNALTEAGLREVGSQSKGKWTLLHYAHPAS